MIQLTLITSDEALTIIACINCNIAAGDNILTESSLMNNVYLFGLSANSDNYGVSEIMGRFNLVLSVNKVVSKESLLVPRIYTSIDNLLWPILSKIAIYWDFFLLDDINGK